MNTNESTTLPLFAQLLESSETQIENGRTRPTYTCMDMPCTMKYPSDDDECRTYND